MTGYLTIDEVKARIIKEKSNVTDHVRDRVRTDMSRMNTDSITLDLGAGDQHLTHAAKVIAGELGELGWHVIVTDSGRTPDSVVISMMISVPTTLG